MKNIITIVLSLSFITLFGQSENYTCRHKQQNQFTNRSNLLSSDELDSIKKYNVHHYAFDIAMDHLSTDIIGTVNLHANAIENIDSMVFELSSR